MQNFKPLMILIMISLFYAQEIYDGYALFTPGGGQISSTTTYLRDNNGNNINTWSHDCGPASMPYFIPGSISFEESILVYPCRSDNPTMSTGGVGGQVKYYNWDGDLLWSYELSSNTYQHHHDVEPLPNGNVLMIAWERLYSSDWQALGRISVDNSLNQMWTTAILEVQPNLDDGSSEVVWEWHITDHLIQDVYGSLDNFGVISEHPELFDVNSGTVGSNGGPGMDPDGDWIHCNAVSYNADLDQIVLSSRFQDEIFIIDHSTTTEQAAGHTGGISGRGGDFLYRWGNPQNYNQGSSSDHILNDQHGVNWIPEGSPGAGNLILFNNNHSNNNSAVLEIETPLLEDGSYEMNDDGTYGPESYIWIHAGNFHSQMQGGAFRLPNGNTFISDADDATIWEIAADGGSTLWSYTYPGNQSMIARGQKIGNEFFASYTIGDVNDDGSINVLDVVLTVNIILGAAVFNPAADMNEDGIINVLDVIQLVNIVIGG